MLCEGWKQCLFAHEDWLVRCNIEVFEFLRLFLEANDFKVIFFVVCKVISFDFFLPLLAKQDPVLFNEFTSSGGFRLQVNDCAFMVDQAILIWLFTNP